MHTAVCKQTNDKQKQNCNKNSCLHVFFSYKQQTVMISSWSSKSTECMNSHHKTKLVHICITVILLTLNPETTFIPFATTWAENYVAFQIRNFTGAWSKFSIPLGENPHDIMHIAGPFQGTLCYLGKSNTSYVRSYTVSVISKPCVTKPMALHACVC